MNLSDWLTVECPYKLMMAVTLTPGPGPARALRGGLCTVRRHPPGRAGGAPQGRPGRHHGVEHTPFPRDRRPSRALPAGSPGLPAALQAPQPAKVGIAGPCYLSCYASLSWKNFFLTVSGDFVEHR